MCSGVCSHRGPAQGLHRNLGGSRSEQESAQIWYIILNAAQGKLLFRKWVCFLSLWDLNFCQAHFLTPLTYQKTAIFGWWFFLNDLNKPYLEVFWSLSVFRIKHPRISSLDVFHFFNNTILFFKATPKFPGDNFHLKWCGMVRGNEEVIKNKSNQFLPFHLLLNFDSLHSLIRVFSLKGESLHSNIYENIRYGLTGESLVR